MVYYVCTYIRYVYMLYGVLCVYAVCCTMCICCMLYYVYMLYGVRTMCICTMCICCMLLYILCMVLVCLHSLLFTLLFHSFVQVFYEFLMSVVWVVFHRQHWQLIHREVGRYVCSLPLASSQHGIPCVVINTYVCICGLGRSPHICKSQSQWLLVGHGVNPPYYSYIGSTHHGQYGYIGSAHHGQYGYIGSAHHGQYGYIGSTHHIIATYGQPTMGNIRM